MIKRRDIEEEEKKQKAQENKITNKEICAMTAKRANDFIDRIVETAMSGNDATATIGPCEIETNRVSRLLPTKIK